VLTDRQGRNRNLRASQTFDAARSVIFPDSPAFARTITRQSPLKAFRSCDWNDSKLVASPLSVATISPARQFQSGPDSASAHGQAVLVPMVL